MNDISDKRFRKEFRVFLTEADSGRTVRLKHPMERFVIRLPADEKDENQWNIVFTYSRKDLKNEPDFHTTGHLLRAPDLDNTLYEYFIMRQDIPMKRRKMYTITFRWEAIETDEPRGKEVHYYVYCQ